MSTVMLLPPDAPQWIVNQWQTLYSSLSNTGLSAAQQSAITSQMNSLAQQARQLQTVAQTQNPLMPILNNIAASMRMMIQQAMPYLRQMLQYAGAPMFAIARYLGLARAFLVSSEAVALLWGALVATAEILLAVIAIMIVLYLLFLLYQMLNDWVNSIQRANILRLQSLNNTPGNETKREAARLIAERDIARCREVFREVVNRSGGPMEVLAQLSAGQA
ncbi:MAG: hypothetical protein ABI972_26415 [Acidobacteriota bacterium]